MRLPLSRRINFLIIPVVYLCFLSTTIYSSESDSTVVAPTDSNKISIHIEEQNADGILSRKILYSTVNSPLPRPLKVRVLSNSVNPVVNYPVKFKIISIPEKSKNVILEHDTVFTDENGYAETNVSLGSKEGDYEFSARIDSAEKENDIVYFKAYARASNWVFFLIAGLLGGLALFLFGMDMMSEGMKKTAGSRLRSILSTITNNRFLAVAMGGFVTMVIQSSSATTVMLVGFVHAKLMTFAQTIGIILGADIGTTVTAQLIAFKLTDYALLILGIGFLLYYFAKSKKIKNVGQTILGFGLLFLGMWIMSEGMKPLRTYDPFINIIMELENPLWGIIVGALFTALIQSSSAFTGILITLGTQGLISLEAAIPLLFGANIGTCVTAALASINTSRDAKKVALAHSLFKVIGVLLFVWWIPTFAELIRSISPTPTSSAGQFQNFAEVVPRQIANAHTIFNVALTVILLPFINTAAKLIEKILPDIEEGDKSEFVTKYIEDSFVTTPSLALNLSKAEIIRMAGIAEQMVERITEPFFNNDKSILEEIEKLESEIDYLNIKINKYLMRVSQVDMNAERADEIFQMMHCVTEIEQIGDTVSKRLVPLARKKIESNLAFSEQGKKEIEEYHEKTMKQIGRAIEVFKDVNLQDAKKMEKKYKKYRLMEMDLRRTHFERLKENIPASVETSEIHLELVDSLKRISSNATNIARIFLEGKRYHGTKPEKESLNEDQEITS